MYTGDCRATIPYCEQRCDAVEAVCGPYSLELVTELLKLLQAHVYW